jgi:hypothetical protein
MRLIRPPARLFVEIPKRPQDSLNAHTERNRKIVRRFAVIRPLTERRPDRETVFVALSGKRWISYPTPPAHPVAIIFEYEVIGVDLHARMADSDAH